MRMSKSFRLAWALTAFIILIVLLLVLPACAPRLKELVHKPTFSRQTLRQSGLALFGVVGQDPGNPDEGDILPSIDTAMWGSLTNRLGDVPIWTVDSTQTGLTPEIHEQLWLHLSETDELDSLTRARLQSRRTYLPGYLLAVRITEDRVWDEMDADGKGGTGYRTMKIRVNIYDIAAADRVWSVDVKHTDYLISQKDEGIKLGPVQIGGDDWDTAPPPPTLHVLTKIFDKLSDELTKRL